jgi:lipopolysaccharide heptosyltransferase I
VKVLIVRIGAMGDVLHAMPAVAALRERYPQWFIGWAIEPRWSDLLQISGDPQDLTQGVVVAGGAIARQGLVDRWYSVPAAAWSKRPLASATTSEILALRRTLRAERFDLCVDMQGALKSAVVGGFASAKSYAGAAEPRERMARHWYAKKIDITATHVVEQGCELLGGAVGETLAAARVTLPMNERAEQWTDETVGQERFALISPGGGWGSKVWPAERLGRVAAELGRAAGLTTIVNASPGGSREADEVAAASEGFARAVPCSIGQLVALTRRAVVVIGGDTGPLHLAAALGRPVVGIYGPTDPQRNGPYGTRSRVLRDAESVTSHKRRHEVEAGMLKITVEEVVEAAREMLG